MAEREKLPTAPFFNDTMKNMPATAKMYKDKYCGTNNSVCARRHPAGGLEKSAMRA